MGEGWELGLEALLVYNLRRLMNTYGPQGPTEVLPYAMATHQDRWQALIMAAVTSMAESLEMERNDLFDNHISPMIDRTADEADAGQRSELAEVLGQLWLFAQPPWIAFDGETRAH